VSPLLPSAPAIFKLSQRRGPASWRDNASEGAGRAAGPVRPRPPDDRRCRRGAKDSDWQPAKDAAKKIAFAEDGAIFEGTRGRHRGHPSRNQQSPMTLPNDVRNYPDAVAQAITSCASSAWTGRIRCCERRCLHRPRRGERLRRPCWSMSGGLSRATSSGPGHLRCLVLTTRGGDFDLYVGQDFSIAMRATPTPPSAYICRKHSHFYCSQRRLRLPLRPPHKLARGGNGA